MRLTINEIIAATNGSYIVSPKDDSAFATSITWDSREVVHGSVYLAIVGEKVDGHSFAAKAIESGALVVVATREVDAAAMQNARLSGAAIIKVEDAQTALADIARAWRSHLNGRVIGLTGSTGKTTTKNLVRDVLAHAGSVVATAKNQNNELGVPKTVLNADDDTDAIVVEMGMRGLHQLDALCEYVKPNWGLISNIGESHIELLGSRENIARAKSELFAALPDNSGVAFLNIADAFCREVCEFSRVFERNVQVVCYDGSIEAQSHVDSFDLATQTTAFVWARDIRLDSEGRATFALCAKNFGCANVGGTSEFVSAQCTLGLSGLHNVSNACAAAAVGYASGLTLEQCAAALSDAKPEQGRQNMIVTNGGGSAPEGVLVIDDAYNANPDSMHAALSTFAALEVSGRRIAILGDMGELGNFSEECHRRVGKFASESNLDKLVCVGDLSKYIVDGAKECGMDASAIDFVDSNEEALRIVSGYSQPGDAVLVKASHFMEFDRIVKRLVG